MSVTLQEVFRLGFAQHARTRRLPLHLYRAARAILGCRTAAMGSHLRGCPEGHEIQVHYNSCRHRACPQCARPRVDRWLDARRQQLLACDHYHVVFTLPHELEPLWHANRQRMIDHLFRAVRDTLLELLEDPKYLGARPGVLATLHTWGRTLSFHPHLHVLVTGGGASPEGWKSVRNGYLLPVRVVRALFRGKLLAALREDVARERLVLPADRSRAWIENLLRRMQQRTWNVRIQERYTHTRGVLLYLGRYLRGGPISNRRLLAASKDRVVFAYTDHRDAKSKVMALPMEQFLQRLLWHVPEPGRHVVRYFGLYARDQAAAREACRAELSALPDAKPSAVAAPSAPWISAPSCSVCGRPLIVLAIWHAGRAPPHAQAS